MFVLILIFFYYYLFRTCSAHVYDSKCVDLGCLMTSSCVCTSILRTYSFLKEHNATQGLDRFSQRRHLVKDP